MREILFRGQTRRYGEKVKMNGEKVPSNWVYGGVCQGKGDFSIIYGSMDMELEQPTEKRVVYTDTIGQYTGLTDKNGTKIFEGDVVTAPYIDPIFHSVWNEGNLTENAVVKYADGMFYIEYVESKQKITLFGLLSGAKEAEVIGNIHDNKLEDFQNGC